LIFIDANSAVRLELVSNSSFNTKTTLYDVLNHCITIGGKRRLRSSILQPSSDIQLIHNRQEAIEEMLSIQEQDLILFKVIRVHISHWCYVMKICLHSSTHYTYYHMVLNSIIISFLLILEHIIQVRRRRKIILVVYKSF